MKKNNQILFAIGIVAVLYLLKNAKDKKIVVLPKMVDAANSNNQIQTAMQQREIITPLQQVTEMIAPKEINSNNRINVRYIAGKTHYI
jgi:hypothetical protein